MGDIGKRGFEVSATSARSPGTEAEPGEPAVLARGLTRRFGPHLALDQLSLEIPRGTTYGLLGANGAGKTTFLRCIMGFLLPSAGSVRVFGRSPCRHPRAVQRAVGFAMETSRLYPELRVRAFLRFVGGARGLRGRERERAIERSVERFHLESVFDRIVGTLSKGYQQRVSLAQALLHDPALVIVDEPTGGLDPLQQAEVREVLRELEGDHTILLSTHDLSEATALASRVAVLSAGRLTAEGPTLDVLGGAAPLALFQAETEVSA